MISSYVYVICYHNNEQIIMLDINLIETLLILSILVFSVDIGAFILLLVICFLLGQGLALSTFQVVLLPTIIGGQMFL